MRISISLEALTGNFETDMNRAMKRVQRDIQRTGRNLTRMGRSMTLGLTTPIVGFGTLALRSAGDFETAMNRVQALSGATGEELEALRDLGKQLGRETQFSATQAADAMGFLAMAGFEANETLQALPGTLQLAASAQIELATAADIVSNVLSGYRLEISDLARVNDVLVKTFTSTNTNLEQLGEAMQYAGPIAAAAGIRFEEAAAAIGLMGNAGIQGTMAGTSLRGALARILNPTSEVTSAMQAAGLSMTDAEGKIRPLVDIIRDLEPHADDAGLMMQLFGQRAGPAMAALVGMGSEALSSLTAELDSSAGTAATISAAQMQGLNGSLKELRSAFEGLQIAIAESGLIDFVTDVVKGLADWTRRMAETNPETLRLMTAIGMFTAVVGPAVLIVGKLISAFGAFLPVVSLVSKVLVAFAAPGAGPVALVIGAVTALIVAWRNWDKIVDFVSSMVTGVTSWLKDKLGKVLDWVGGKVQAVTGFFRDMYDKVVGNSYVPDMVDGIEHEFGRLPGVMVQPALAATGATVQAFEDAAGSIGDSAGGFSRWAVDLEEMGREAARNIHQSFVDFMMNPFEDGLKGMLKSFAQMLQRMIAEAAAAQILGGLFSGMAGSSNQLAASFGAAFGGSRDSGGRGYPGQEYLIGTGAQPERFIPDTAGTFVPASQQSGGTNIFQTIVQAPEGRITRESEGRMRARDQQRSSMMASRNA